MVEDAAAPVTLQCVTCNSQLMKPSEQIKEFIGLVCGNDKCARFGLLTVVGKSVKREPESKIITPDEPKIIQS